jgi:azurin
MTRIRASLVAGVAALLLAAVASTPAAARIQCQGNFQVTQNGLIATPYCEEEQIALVARSYGQKVTGAMVHNNALTKVYLCQTIGYDQRLKGSCAGYSPENFGPR